MKDSLRIKAGFSLFVGMTIFVIGLNLAEQLYPGYSVSQNYISDLGATCRSGNCQIFQPSALIFNSSMILCGLFVIHGAYLIYREFRPHFLAASMAISGIGAMCVGFFPEYTGSIHSISALTTFIFGGASPIIAAARMKSPFRYLSILLGIVSLAAVVLYASHQYLGLGKGGMERLVVYPFVLWVLGFGGMLMYQDNEDLKNVALVDRDS